MALDRFVYWKDKAPDKGQLERTLIAYAGTMADIAFRDDRWYINIPGKPSCALENYYGVGMLRDLPDERWIEVWPGDDCVDVITRQADDITNAIAEGLARLLARLWNGKCEGP